MSWSGHALPAPLPLLARLPVPGPMDSVEKADEMSITGSRRAREVRYVINCCLPAASLAVLPQDTIFLEEAFHFPGAGRRAGRAPLLRRFDMTSSNTIVPMA